MLPSWLNENRLLLLETLVEVLPVVSVIGTIEIRWGVLMSFVPLVIVRR